MFIQKKVSLIVFIIGLILIGSFIAYADTITPNFPTSLNAWDDGDVIEDEDIEAIEAKIGVNSSAVTTSIDYLIKNSASKLGSIYNITPTDGVFIVADGSKFVGESGATARTSIGLGSVENTALSTWVGSSYITTLGIISTGIWQGTAIGNSYIASSTEYLADTNTTYTATGTLLNLTGTAFSVNAGTLTTTKGCIYTLGTGLVCNSTFLTAYSETDPIWLVASSSYLTTASSTATYFTIAGANASNTSWLADTKWTGISTDLVAATGRTSLELGTMALLANTGSTTITTLGTIATGVWSGTSILNAKIASSTEFLSDIYWTGVSTNLVAATGRTSLGLGTMALEANTGSTTITTLGTIATGTWSATAIANTKGGTGLTIAPSIHGQLLMASSTSWVIGSLVAGSNITLTTSTPGQITIASSGGGGGVATTTPFSAGYIPYATSSTAITNSNIFQSGANIGIGTTTPNNLLSVYEYIDFNPTDLNTKIGYQAGKNIVSGATYNVFLGYQAGLSSAASSTNLADNNTAIGYQSLYSNTTGYSNFAMGNQSLQYNTTGYNNTAIGALSLRNNSTGNYNTAIGYYSLGVNTNTGSNNLGIGYQALGANTSGSKNVGIGEQTLYNNSTGLSNVALGYMAGKYETGSNAFYINNVDQSNTANDKAYSLLYGTFAGTAATTTGQQLTVNGGFTVNGNATTTALSITGLKSGFLKVNGNGLVSTSTVGVADVHPELFTKMITFSIKNATTTNNPASCHKFATAITISRISCAINNATSSVQLDERAEATPFTSGTDVLNSVLICDTNTEATTTFANAGIAADVPFCLDIDTMAGNSTTTMFVHIDYTVDD